MDNSFHATTYGASYSLLKSFRNSKLWIHHELFSFDLTYGPNFRPIHVILQQISFYIYCWIPVRYTHIGWIYTHIGWILKSIISGQEHVNFKFYIILIFKMRKHFERLRNLFKVTQLENDRIKIQAPAIWCQVPCVC